MPAYAQKGLVVVGSGGHGKDVLDTAIAAGYPIRGFIDNTKPEGTVVNTIPILGGNELLDDRTFIDAYSFVVAIGHQQARRNLTLSIKNNGGSLATVVHPSCAVSPFARI